MSSYRRPRLAAGRSLQTCRPRFPACSGKDMATMDQANVNMRAITIYLLSETITCTVYSTTALLSTESHRMSIVTHAHSKK